ncbi:hypothetical protein CZ794_08675 [Psychrobacter sp. JB385]|nr:hypothetical protein CZ794_08675 [Psychrobacter sp. JB385]
MAVVIGSNPKKYGYQYRLATYKNCLSRSYLHSNVQHIDEL